jgi:hypothetical protein
MNRKDLSDLVFAIGQITGLDEFDVVGGQSILGSFDEHDLPEEVVRSPEIDAVLSEHPRIDSLLIQLGSGSRYAAEVGSWVDVVTPTTADLPRGWRARRVAFHVIGAPGPIAWCPEITDLAASKMSRLAENDKEFVISLIDAGLLDPDLLAFRVRDLERTNRQQKQIALAWLERIRQGR